MMSTMCRIHCFLTDQLAFATSSHYPLVQLADITFLNRSNLIQRHEKYYMHRNNANLLVESLSRFCVLASCLDFWKIATFLIFCYGCNSDLLLAH